MSGFCTHKPPHSTWITQEDEYIPICHLKHLKNTEKFLEKKYNKASSETISAYYAADTFRGEMASQMAEDAADELGEIEFETHIWLLTIQEEQKRRRNLLHAT